MYYGPPGANNGTIIYEKLNTVRTANGSYHWMFLLGGQNKTYTCYWRNLIYYSNGYIGGAFCFNDGFSKGTYIFHNLLSVAATNGALVFNGTAGLTVENSTVYGTVIGDNDSGYDIYEGASTYVNRNLASFDNVRYNSGLKGTIYNCATSFSSEPGFTRLGMKSSDVFMSTTMTDGDRFLRPKSLPPSPSKTLVYGTAPGIGANTYDISGKTRPAQKNVYWIGAKDGMIIPKKHISFQDPGIF